MEPTLLSLAREAVEQFVRHRRVIPAPPLPPSGLPERAAAFVTIWKRGELRGCIGTLEPQRATLSGEVVQNAISAATDDPRFAPVTAAELAEIQYEVDVLEPLEPVADESALDPQIYGVVVQAGRRRGVLLPGLRGVRSVAQQLEIARSKAGIMPAERVTLFRFRIRRFKEEAPGS